MADAIRIPDQARHRPGGAAPAGRDELLCGVSEVSGSAPVPRSVRAGLSCTDDASVAEAAERPSHCVLEMVPPSTVVSVRVRREPDITAEPVETVSGQMEKVDLMSAKIFRVLLWGFGPPLGGSRSISRYWRFD